MRSVPVSLGGYTTWLDERRAQPSGPGDRLPLQQLGEQLELLLEQLLVVRQVVAEQRERLGERAAADDHFGAPVRDRVQRREPLEDAHRIVGAQHGDRRAEMNPRGPRGDRGQHDFRRGDREVRAMVLADAEEGEPDLIGEHAFLDDVAEHCAWRSG